MAVVTLDGETKSYSDLKKVGPWPYSCDPTTEIICLCYKIGDGPVIDWWPGMNETDDSPGDLREAIKRGDIFEAHNVAFEISFWINILHKRLGWPLVPVKQWRDSMATACYFALPPALDRLCKALGLPGKNPEGARLITKYSKLHLKTAKTEIPDEDFFKFVDYCRGDVEIEHAASEIMGDLPEIEQEIFTRDLETNLRGIYLDQEGIAVAAGIVDRRAEELTEEFRALTGYNPGQGAKLLVWFAEQGLTLDNMQAEYLGDLLEGDAIPAGPARRALQIRLEINKASTKKLDAMARQCGSDGRARFQTRYHGAVTGRNTGSGFQPLNLVKGVENIEPDDLVRDIMLGDAGWLDACYGDAMEAVSKASRHWIKAAPGHRILAGDYVSVEAVIGSCLADETWKVEAFRQKLPVYEMSADRIYGLPPGTVTKATHPAERQDGKRCELAFLFQGALGAWLKFDPHPIHSDETIIGFCKAWRQLHPETVSLWRNLEDAAVKAVRFPKEAAVVEPSGIEFQVIDNWLTMRLLDGKRIWYFDPQLRASMPQWHKPMLPFLDDKGKPSLVGVEPNPCNTGDCTCKPRPQVTYLTQKEGQWKRVSTYGGKLTENACQAHSRQALEPAKKRLAAAGYHVILTVYDEIVCEVPEGFGSKKEFEQIMGEAPGPWTAGWPLSVSAWEGERYRS